jgi:hypothetical protein
MDIFAIGQLFHGFFFYPQAAYLQFIVDSNEFDVAMCQSKAGQMDDRENCRELHLD